MNASASLWYRDHEGNIDWQFLITVLLLGLLLSFTVWLFYNAAKTTNAACRARGMEMFESRGYFCIDNEGRLYKP
jgi:RsiW-degrading membrane proteinase PrsW (M82 family)